MRRVSEPEKAASPIDISAVIPVYNEEQNLGLLYEQLKAVMQELELRHEIIFVDDGSTDGSYNVAKGLHAKDDCVKLIRFRRNFGQTAAFSAGFDYARGDLVVTLDADGQNDPADIPRLLDKLHEGDYDIVTGWRVNRQESFVRRLLSKMGNWVISRASHISIQDRGCSLKIFRTELVKNMQLYGQLHRFLPELASTIGARVAEVPVNDRDRQFGQSKYGALTRAPRVILDLVTVSFLLGFFSTPMRFFGSIAFVSGSLGTLIGGGLALTKIYRGLVGGWESFHAYEIGARPLLLFSFMLILLSVQFLMMGLLGEMIMRTYYEAQDKPTYFVRDVLD
ncbi:MAG: glycosyltransferase family 2 protein [Chloroflexi bacterium]|nr:glycosyltransferase family 2 protein [Chloroflexota bacterium]